MHKNATSITNSNSGAAVVYGTFAACLALGINCELFSPLVIGFILMNLSLTLVQ